MIPRAGDLIGRYQVIEPIGRGGFAVVYRARDPRLNSDVAIKVLAENHAFDPDVRERFAHEAQVLRGIDDQSVISVLDVGETSSGQPYLVMAYADRGTLADRLPAETPVGPADLTEVVSFLGQSLAALHAQRLVHRDVKPSNILIRSRPGTQRALSAESQDLHTAGSLLADDEYLVLGDLGLVKDLALASGFTVGTGSTHYAAPEQQAGASRVDERADLHAAGAVLAELVLGARPATGQTWVDVLDARGSGPILEFLRRSLDEDPDRRPATIKAWQVGATAAIEFSASQATTDGRQTQSRRRPLIAAALVALALVAGPALWLNRSSTPPDPLASQPLDDGSPTTTSSTSDNSADEAQPASTAEGVSVEGFEATEIDGGSVHLRWQAPGEATGVNIFIRSPEDQAPRWFDFVPTGRDSYWVHGLALSTEHEISLRPVSEVNPDDSLPATALVIRTGDSPRRGSAGPGTSIESVLSELCMVPDGSRAAIQQTCGDGDTARYRVEPSPLADAPSTVTIVHLPSNECLTVGDVELVGEAGVIWRSATFDTCAGDEIHQRFDLVEVAGTVTVQALSTGSAAGGGPWCLDVKGTSVEAGAELVFFDCHGALNQRWLLATP